MRERELKRPSDAEAIALSASLPMRERELKPQYGRKEYQHRVSLPMRERELKRRGRHLQPPQRRRSPCGSAN